MIEVFAFQLADGADEAAFLAADRQVQTEFAYQQPGLLRRTTARSPEGQWIVIDIWQDAASAEACDERWSKDPLAKHFMSFVDRRSVRSKRYFELD